MVKIRLTRTGKRHEPHYRIVATDSRVKRDGKYLEKIGYYNPRTKPPTLDYNKDILQKWLDTGAQMTDTVHDIFVKEGIVKQSKKRTARVKLMVERSKKLASESEEGDTSAEAPTDTPAETPTEKKAKPKNDEPTDDKKEDTKKKVATKKDQPEEPLAEEKSEKKTKK